MNSREANRVFCSIELKLAREEARKAGVKVGKLSTWSENYGGRKHYEVWDEHGRVWSGQADNAADAKSKCIWSLLPIEEDKE